MKRAVELFAFERRPSESPLIADTWETQSGDDEDSFLSVAATNWEMVVTRQQDTTWLVVRGPETVASVAPVPLDAEFFGIQFSLGTFMPCVRLRGLVGKGLVLPPMSAKSFWLDGAEWELPQARNADVFVDRLVRAGLLVHDPVVPAALADDTVDGLSTRSVERRVARATGLTRGTIRQIHRAERAVELLGEGVAPLEVARRAGYTDQPHLTRSLKRFVGRTPAQLAGPS
jgi:Helix-turn-helix domain